jgi:hypothetical protein
MWPPASADTPAVPADNAGPQLLGDSNLPRRARSDLLTGDEAIGQPAVNRGSIHSQNLRRFADGNQLSVQGFGRRLEARDVAISPQTPDLIGVKRSPVAVLRPWRFRIPAMTSSG